MLTDEISSLNEKVSSGLCRLVILLPNRKLVHMINTGKNMIKPLDEIILPYVSIRYTKPIVYYTYSKETELGFPEVKELIMCAEKLSGHTPYTVLAYARNLVTLTNEGKRMLTDVSNMPLFRGTAVLVKNNLHKYATDFVRLYNKPKYPFRAFTDKQQAIDWLLTLPL